MTVYSVRYDNNGSEGSGTGVIWVGAKHKILEAKREIKRLGHEVTDISEVDIPLRKKELLVWLNCYASIG